MRMQKEDWTAEWLCNRCKTNKSKGNIIRRKRFQDLKIGSLNYRGLKGTGGAAKKSQIADDMRKYNLEILALQETHIGGDPEDIETLL